MQVIISASDSASLVSALKSAHAGDTISLAGGVYSPLTLSGLQFNSAVTITSANADAPAVLTGMTLSNSSGLTFQDVTLSTEGAKVPYPFQIIGSSKITFDHVDVHGSLDGNAQNDASGPLFRESSDIKVINSEFQQLTVGTSFLNSKNVVVSGNSFHDIQTDGVDGGGTSNIVISDNYFTDFDPIDSLHPDAIQLWTTNTTASAHDITITGNLIVRGDGEPIQGIFLRDQVGNLPYLNVTITANTVIGSMANGIMIDGAVGATIAGNVVAGLPDLVANIRMENVKDLSLSDNDATGYLLTRNTGVTQADNDTIRTPSDGGQALASQWQLAHDGATSLITAGKGLVQGLLADGGLGATVQTAAQAAVSAGLAAASLSALQNIEAARVQAVTIAGTSGADNLVASATRDSYLNGGEGNDFLRSVGIGHNTMAGGAGDDLYYVNSVTDKVIELAGAGKDSVVASIDYELTDNIENLTLGGVASFGAGNALDNRIIGGTRSDTLSGLDGADTVQGGEGGDLILGGAGDDQLIGGAGGDTLVGDAGADKLLGGEGNDSLSGGAGVDTLEAGNGADSLSGGAGADMFLFRPGSAAVDAGGVNIFDFSALEGDKISLTAIDANTKIASDQAFTYVGTNAFKGIAGELRSVIDAGGTHLQGDMNGDGVADIDIYLIGVKTLTASSLWL